MVSPYLYICFDGFVFGLNPCYAILGSSLRLCISVFCRLSHPPARQGEIEFTHDKWPTLTDSIAEFRRGPALTELIVESVLACPSRPFGRGKLKLFHGSKTMRAIGYIALGGGGLNERADPFPFRIARILTTKWSRAAASKSKNNIYLNR